jgi:gliding motility-associated-like protein
MRIRSFLILSALLIFSVTKAQPPEVIYDGTVIATGFRQSIPPASDGPFPLGFSFTYFGNSYSQFYVSANGLVMFVDPADAYNNEVTIPNTAAPNNYIAPFWDNLSIIDGGNIMYRTIGVAPSRKCVIQFRNMGFDPIPTTFGTFQVILYETSNIIQFQYRLIVDPYSPAHHGASATIGLENSTGTAGVLYAYHNPNAVNSEDAISFTPSGPTYTVNSDAMYDGVYLTTNLTLPDPGITVLLSPATDAIIGSSQTFEWAEPSNAALYYLLIDTVSSLATANYYYPGTALSYNVTGLLLGKTYYWAVYASNATGITWCEVTRFSTSSTPPLAAVPQTIWAEQGQDKTIKLNYTGGNASAKTAIITSLPAQGTLWQYNTGVKGVQITAVPATVTDENMNIIYTAPASSGNGIGNFNFKMNDSGGDSPEVTITVNVSPPGIPSVLYIAKGTGVEIQFDRLMANPAGKELQFTVSVNGTPATITSSTLKTGDPFTITLGLSPGLTGTETVLVSYAQGDVTSAQGGFLLSFTDQPVTLRSQTINFTQSLDKKLNESPFNLAATASSSLGMAYSSSSLSIATISSNVVTLQSVGTSEITARQAGNETWAPAKYIRVLTVAKGDQTITFPPISDHTYGEPDFPLAAVASSGLQVGYTSSNTAVATVTGNTVHIVGAGTTTITASQGGDSNWNPAADVPQTLTVFVANVTVTLGNLTATYDGLGHAATATTTPAGLTVLITYDGSTDIPVDAGSYAVAASVNEPGYHGTATGTLIISKADQTITFGPISDRTYGEPDFTLGAVAGSGLQVGYTSSNTAVATISGNSVHIVGAGSTVITASQAGDANWNAASDVQQTLTVNKADQTITFDPINGRTYGEPDFTLAAVAGSGLQVGYTSSNTAVATVTGNTVHIVGAGTTTITASQAGDANWNAAADVQQTLTVNKADQTITFAPVSNRTYGDADFALSAVAGSGLQVGYTSSNTDVATVTGNTVHIVGAGTTTITASQAGDANWNAAPDVPRTLVVNKASLTFTADNKTKSYLAPVPLLTYTITGFVMGEEQSVLDLLPTIATTATVSSPEGTYTITLTGGNDNNYTFIYIGGILTITKLGQVITITDIPVKLLVGDTYTLVATSTSGLAVQFESLDTDIATVSGNLITGVSKGNVQIRAFHPGDQNFDPAEAFATIEVYSTHKNIMYLFTPNGDGFNDYWELPELASWGKCDVRVYNRWGKLVFASPDYHNEWTGLSNGNPLPEGAYIFIIETENSGVVKGTVNIVR